MLLVPLIVASIVTILYKLIKSMKYWEERGVPYVKPWPFFGNMAPMVFQRRSFIGNIDDLYNAQPDQRYSGVYQFTTPALLIRDPDLLKTICVKEFHIFPEHRTMVSKEVDALWGKNLFAMKYEDGWREKRSMLTSAFKSGKMKAMFPSMLICAQRFKRHLQRNRTTEINVRDITTRYAADVIALTVLGFSHNSLENPDDQFHSSIKSSTEINIRQLLKFFGFSIWPSVMKLLRVPVFDGKVSSFLNNTVAKALAQRLKTNLKKPDMIQLLMESAVDQNEIGDDIKSEEYAAIEDLHEDTTRRLPEIDDITALFMAFFLAGYETSSNVISFAFYELAVNGDIQRKLLGEIDATTSIKDVTYETLLEMKYLDMFLSETLRKWTPSPASDRQAVKEFTIEPKLPGEKPIRLEKGTGIWIPIHGIHHDPKYFPDPERFDPERFSPENKHKIKPGTYIPFGMGPRGCIGSRFFLLESKLLIVETLRAFEVVTVSKTQIPMKLSKKNIHPLPDEGIWVGFVARNR